MARKRDDLSEHEAIGDIVSRLLVAMELVATPSSTEAGETSRPVGPCVFLFTSPLGGQGTSSIACAVGEIMAQMGRRTVVARVVATNDDPRAMTETNALLSGFEGDLLVTAKVPARYGDLPEALRDPHDWMDGCEVVILDSASLTDGLTRYWTPKVDGIVLVVDGEGVSVGAVVHARDNIAQLGGKLVGVVLNRYRSRIPSFIEPFLPYG